MRYSQLAAFVTVLLANFGELDPMEATQFQEDCCGEGQLTAGVRLFGLKAGRRDASRLQKNAHSTNLTIVPMKGIKYFSVR